MYSPDIERICAMCVNAKPVKGVVTHVKCQVHGGYVGCTREACDSFRYDIFKKKVRRKKPGNKEYAPETFKL